MLFKAESLEKKDIEDIDLLAYRRKTGHKTNKQKKTQKTKNTKPAVLDKPLLPFAKHLWRLPERVTCP